ncbi:DNA repair/recombination protein [Actinidia rufa]|uniref:DNA repair/recombination protein n=1 Tax=Actinidia rufa TaxID=165716 RepID=A0A7J0EU41_9ERIC|nr:DNA repair/recombination protein [Actinidia rufa]
MEEEDEEVSSPSDPSDSSDEFTCDRQSESESESESESDDSDNGNDVDEGDEPSTVPRAPSKDDRKSQNVAALVTGNLLVKRQSLLPRVLSVTDRAAVVRKPFKPPCPNGYSDQNEHLVRRLWARKRFVPWGSTRPALVAITNRLNIPSTAEKEVSEEIVSLPPGVEPLVLWQPEECDEGAGSLVPISVEYLLVHFLRPHQSLGKTLQSITLLYTLLRQGFDGKPMVKKAIVVTPTSLVSNWEAEINKWVGERVQLVALCESTRDDVVSGIDNFTSPRSHLQALAALSCKRRILLSGTPMQNDLEEFYAMVNFTNPGILGDAAYFRRYYEAPIICGREPTATEEEKKLGAERSAELSAKVNQVKQVITEEMKQSKILAYITVLKKLCNHPKLIYDTIKNGSPGTSGFEECLRFFPPEMFSGRSGAWTGGDGSWVELSGKMHVLARLLAQLRQRTDDRIVLVSNYTQTLDLFAQLCRERRYPFLRLDGTTSISKRQKLVNRFNDPSKDEFVFLLSSKAGGCGLNLIGGNRLVLFDPDWNPANDKQAAARVWRDGQKKRVFIYRFLSTGTIEEKVYQRQMSKEGLQKVIQQEQTDINKAQGNFLSTEDLRDLFTFHENARSEIHEKMSCIRCQNYDTVVDDRPDKVNDIDGFQTTDEGCQSDQDDIGGFASTAGCLHRLRSSEKQVGTPLEEDLGSWGHHFLATSVPDAIFQASAGEEVTFVFTNQIGGKLVPVESMRSPKTCGAEGNKNDPGSKENPRLKPIFSSRQCSSPSVSSNVGSVRSMLPTSCKLLQRANFKSVRSSLKGTLEVALKPKLSPGNQLPQKRLSPDAVDDDDFQ